MVGQRSPPSFFGSVSTPSAAIVTHPSALAASLNCWSESMFEYASVLQMTRIGHDFCGSNPEGTTSASFAWASLALPSLAASARRFVESGISTVKTSLGDGDNDEPFVATTPAPDEGDVDLAVIAESSATSMAEFSTPFTFLRLEFFGSRTQSLPFTKNL